MGDQFIYNYNFNKSDNETNKLSLVFGFGKLTLILILFVVIFRSLTGSNNITLTFSSFLSGLSTAPQIDLSWARSFTIPTWLQDVWIIGPLLNLLANGAAFATYITGGLVNVVLMVGWILGFLIL